MPATFKGEVVTELKDFGNLSVQVVLNNEDEQAKQQNNGKPQPVLIRNLIKVDDPTGISYPNVVVVQSGSVIKFNIKSKGPYGYGYRIRTDKEPIVDRLYCLDKEGKNAELIASVRKYQLTGSMIRVDDFKTLGYGVDKERTKASEVWICRIESWNVFGFIDDYSRTYGTPRGETEVTVSLIGAGAGEWGKSNEIFTKARQVFEVDPEAQKNGYLSFYFFVFASMKEQEQFFQLYKAALPDADLWG